MPLDLQKVGKLSRDANLQYLYCGAQKTWGAQRKCSGKVALSQLERFAIFISRPACPL